VASPKRIPVILVACFFMNNASPKRYTNVKRPCDSVQRSNPMRTHSTGKKNNTPVKTTLYVPFPVFFASMLAEIDLFGAVKSPDIVIFCYLLLPSVVFCCLLESKPAWGRYTMLPLVAF
jgi:hypothetical protein